MHVPMMSSSSPWSGGTSDMWHRATESRMSAPWAMVGMLTAFVGGAFLGMATKGHGMSMMRKHHHHGEGSPCRSKHMGQEMAAPGAGGAQEQERNEGE